MGLTMKERNSVTKEIAERYRHSDRKAKKDILNEYIQLTGFHRKYAIAKLNSCIKKREHNFNERIIKTSKVELTKKKKRIYIPKYGIDVINSLIRIRQTFDYMCGQRPVPFIRENIDDLEAEPYFQIPVEIRSQLLQISSATVNRELKGERRKNKLHGTTTTKAAGNLNKRVYFDWDDRNPGFFEMDTVAHDSGNAYVEYCYTLTFTDVCTGWTVLYALLNRAHSWVKESAEDLRTCLKSSQKKHYEGQYDELQCCSKGAFAVLPKSPLFFKPCKTSLYDPPFGNNCKCMQFIAFDYLYRYPLS